MYAIGGEVSISTPSGSTPEEKLKNARTLASAALAAGSPSSQDFSVAASAKSMETQALQEITKKSQEKLNGNSAYKEASLTTPSSQNTKEAYQSLDISA